MQHVYSIMLLSTTMFQKMRYIEEKIIDREDNIEDERIEIENNANMRARGNIVREAIIQRYFYLKLCYF